MIRTIVITLLCCAAFGLVRMPLEEHIMRREHRDSLLPTPLPPQVKTGLGQQLAFLSLGGMGSLVASFLSVDAFTYFKREDWAGLEERYRLITALAPHTGYYWQVIASHLARDAASARGGDRSLSRHERRLVYKNYVDKGKKYLTQGIAANPEDPSLHKTQGDLLSDSLRYPDYDRAAKAYANAYRLTGNPLYRRMEFYNLARQPSRTAEAWQLGRALYQDRNHRVPSLIAVLFALENRLKLPEGERIPFDQLFADESDPYELLYLQMASNLRNPTDGFRETIDARYREAPQGTPVPQK